MEGRQRTLQTAWLQWANTGCFVHPACSSHVTAVLVTRANTSRLSQEERTWISPFFSPGLAQAATSTALNEGSGIPHITSRIPHSCSPSQQHTDGWDSSSQEPLTTLLSLHLLCFLLLLLFHLCRGLHLSSSSPPSVHPSHSPGASIASCLSPLFPRVMSTPSQL